MMSFVRNSVRFNFLFLVFLFNLLGCRDTSTEESVPPEVREKVMARARSICSRKIVWKGFDGKRVLLECQFQDGETFWALISHFLPSDEERIKNALVAPCGRVIPPNIVAEVDETGVRK